MFLRRSKRLLDLVRNKEQRNIIHIEDKIRSNVSTIRVAFQVPMTHRRSKSESRKKVLINSTSYTIDECGERIIKAVQTAFSSVDFTVTDKCCDCRITSRQTRSHENLRQDDTQDEILGWLREACNIRKIRKWTEKLHRLAQKLGKPGVEERLKMKIKKYLNKMPSEFSECDEDGKEFREQLPDNIIKKLKNIYVDPSDDNRQETTVNLFRLEVSKDLNNTDYKGVIKNWFKAVPLRKRDFLDRSIRRSDIYDFIVHRLEPFILHRPKSNIDFKCILKSYLMEIIYEIPIDTHGFNRKDYLNTITNELVENLSKTNENSKLTICPSRIVNYRQSTINFTKKSKHRNKIDKKNESSLIEDFVKHEIMLFLEETDWAISRRRIMCIEIELTEILINAELEHIDDRLLNELHIVLHDIGKLPEYYAKHYAKVILKKFKAVFSFNSGARETKHKRVGSSFSKTYLVYYKSSDDNNLSDDDKTDKKKSENVTSEEDVKTNQKMYTKKVEEQIDKWLTKLDLKIPLVHQQSFRNIAISDLAGDIVERHKKLELHSSSQSSEDELENLKGQIYQWMGKLVGDDNMETMDHASELMKRIRRIPIPKLTKPHERGKASTSQQVQEKSETLPKRNHKVSDKPYLEKLYRTIFEWFHDVPYELRSAGDERFRIQLVTDLADNIEKGIQENKNIDDVIDKEVDIWSKKALKRIPETDILELLKEKAKEISFPCFEPIVIPVTKNDVSLQAETTTSNCGNNTVVSIEDISEVDTNKNLDVYLKQVSKQIDEWLKQLIPQIQENPFKNLAVSDLAGDIVDRYKYLELNSSICSSSEDDLENLKYQIFKWINKLVGEENLQTIQHAPELLQRIKSIPAPELTRQHDNTNLKHRLNLNSKPDEIKPMPLPSPASEIQTNQKPSPSSGGEIHNNIQSPTFKSTPPVKNSYPNVNSNIFPGVRPIPPVRSSIQNLNPGYNINKDFFRPTQSVRTSIQNVNSNQLPTGMQPMQHVLYPNGSNMNSVPSIKSNPVGWFGQNNRGYEAEGYQGVKPIRQNSFLGYPTSLKADVDSTVSEVYQVPNVGKPRAGSVKEESKAKKDNKRESAPAKLAIPKTPLQSVTEAEGIAELPQGMTVTQTYEYFDVIFKDFCQDLPITASTPDEQALLELARKGIHNGIWKTYFKLQSNPDIENDYTLFEAVFEDELDSLLDCLPQTKELKSYRQGWKGKVILSTSNMLKYVHGITDSPSFRQQLADRFNRQFIRARFNRYSDKMQHAFVINAADAYILYTRYKNEDPMKANIYKHRLMKKLEDIAEHVKKVNNMDFRNVNQPQLCQEAFKILGTVPIPNDETLKDEADEILLGEEIKEWYNHLPVKPLKSEAHNLMRNRLQEVLARKLHKIEKQVALDDASMEREIRNKVSRFLNDDAELQADMDLNINSMVDQITHKMLHKRHNSFVGYDTFAQSKPASSSFAEMGHGTPLAPLITPADKSIYGQTLTPNVCSSQMASQNVQAPQPYGSYQANLMPPAQYPMQPSSSQGIYSQGPTPTGIMRSTAVVNQMSNAEDDSEYESDDDGHQVVRCRCLERVYQCRRRYEMERQCYYPMPPPCRYMYY